MNLSACMNESWKRRLTSRVSLLYLWLAIAIMAALSKMHSHNVYDIYRYVFYNTLGGNSLYAASTDGGFSDLNHYGPFFSVIIAPFALCPTWNGLILWSVALSLFLYWAVYKSTLSCRQQIFIYWFCAHELLTALFMSQFNVAIAAIILLAYAFVEKGRDELATCLIAIGTLVKFYGILGLAFFPFSNNKKRFLLTLGLWMVLLPLVPSIYSSADFQLSQYVEWIHNIIEKNASNGVSLYQNISVMGMAHRITGMQFSDLWILIPAVVLFALPYLRVGQWKYKAFRETILASSLMSVCLFSTGTESSGYIIAMSGVAVWYTAQPWKRGSLDLFLMVFCFILTSMSPSDLFPKYLREEYVLRYALKALPVFIIWLRLITEALTHEYSPEVE